MWSTLIDWIGSPQAYNWITLLGAFSAMVAALFTGYTASAQWKDRRKRVVAEWDLVFDNLTPRVKVRITNHTDHTISGCTIKISGPVVDIVGLQGGHVSERNTSGRLREAYVPTSIAPGATQSVSFQFRPELSDLRKLASSKLMGAKLSVVKLFWHSLGWRLPFGVKFPIVLMLRRSSSHIRSIRLTHTIRINPETAAQIAAKVENKADKT